MNRHLKSRSIVTLVLVASLITFIRVSEKENKF